jgi:hypothetical protein
MDVRQHQLRTGQWSFALDGKSTFGKSVSVTREMWEKAVLQAENERPILPLRFFDDYRMKGGTHLAVLDANDLAGLIEAARKIDAVKEFLNSDWMEGEIAYAADGPGAEQMIFERKLLAILNA